MTYIGRIFDPNELPQYQTLCNDGTYSSATTTRACRYHGGVREFGVSVETALPRAVEAHPAAVYLIPLGEVYFARDLFQNREAEYSEESVQRIIEAVEKGTFRFEVFDPVLLWQHKNKLFVLSGHSRTEAFTRLSAAGYSDFDAIPAKVITATVDEARRIALTSNTLSTRETDTERAAYYRELLVSGEDVKAVEREAKQNEGTNAARIINYAYLTPGGLTLTTLTALEGKDDTSQENIKNVANWIGAAMRRRPELSAMHEDEIYRWLVAGAFGKQYTNMRDFLTKIDAVIYQRTEFGKFDADNPLNLQNLGGASHGEQQYNANKAQLAATVREIDKLLKNKTKELQQRGASAADMDRILKPLEMQLRTARLKLADFLNNATRPGEASKNELNLFAVSGLKRKYSTHRAYMLL